MTSEANTQVAQTQLMMTWKSMHFQGQPLPKLDEVHFRVLSQNGEDGILLYIFSLLGTTNKKAVEICAGDGQTCCAANLIVNHGWEGTLFDGRQNNIDKAAKFYQEQRDTRFWPPKLVQAWITKDNINDLITNACGGGEIDLLSLDIDGNDYWIWEALDIVQPRVVIAEYQQAWGPDIAVTQRYEEDFSQAEHKKKNPGPSYIGASLKALVQLAHKKGMRLIGCERKCFNAIFVRKGLGEDIFPTIDPADCFDHDMARYNIAWMPENVDTKDPFWEYL